MVQNPTIFCEVFVTDSTTPPFQNKTYSTLRSYRYKILHCIMVLIRWKCLGRCNGIHRAVQEYFKTIDNDNTVWTVLAKIQWKSFTKGHPFQARWLKALACDTVHSLHVEMCVRQKPHWYPQTCIPNPSLTNLTSCELNPAKISETNLKSLVVILGLGSNSKQNLTNISKFPNLVVQYKTKSYHCPLWKIPHGGSSISFFPREKYFTSSNQLFSHL